MLAVVHKLYHRMLFVNVQITYLGNDGHECKFEWHPYTISSHCIAFQLTGQLPVANKYMDASHLKKGCWHSTSHRIRIAIQVRNRGLMGRMLRVRQKT